MAQRLAFGLNPVYINETTNGSRLAPVVYTNDAPSNAYSVSVAEAVSAADVVAQLTAYALAVSEATSAADAVTVLGTYAVGVSETSSALDTPSALGVFGLTLVESTSTSDIYAVGNILSLGVAEAASASDLYEMIKSINLTVVEVAAAVDYTNGGFAYPVEVTEFSNLSDTQASVIYVKPYLSFRRVDPPPEGQGPGNPGVLYIAFTRDG